MEIRPQITPEDVQSKSGDHLRDRLVITNLFQVNLVTYIMSARNGLGQGPVVADLGVSIENHGCRQRGKEPVRD